jgi:hypothetical protein
MAAAPGGPERRIETKSHKVVSPENIENSMDKQAVICERLKKLGYVSDRHIRLYGEDLQLVSNPVAEETGYSVLALVVGTGNLRHLRIPLSAVCILEREFEREQAAQLIP